MTRRVLETFCPQNVCVDFLVPAKNSIRCETTICSELTTRSTGALHWNDGEFAIKTHLQPSGALRNFTPATIKGRK